MTGRRPGPEEFSRGPFTDPRHPPRLGSESELVRDAGSLRFSELDPVTEARVDELLGQMTLSEKVGQLVQVHVIHFLQSGVSDAVGEGKPSHSPANLSAPSINSEIERRLCSGAIGSIFGSTDTRLINRCQRLAVEGSRLGIPLLVGNDVIHGLRTVFPIPLGTSCTWDPELVQQIAYVAAEESSATGTDWVFAPMVDVARDPRWGRIAEGWGEDPFLSGAMAAAEVRGFQSTGLASGRCVAACPKHFAGYGAVEAGREYNIVDISERTLRDVHLPPFRSAFRAGAGSVMTSFNEIAGVPATANARTLRHVLRDEWEWPGLTVSDYSAIPELMLHGIAADKTDAARVSILAGLDMDMMGEVYAEHLGGLVTDGLVPLELVDEAVRRVLHLKIWLGLFERPYTDEALAPVVLLRDDFRDIALKAAQESVVLLKNERSLLPLASTAGHIALLGPLADNRSDLLGSWAMNGRPEDVETVLEGMQAHLQQAGELTCLPGVSVQGDGPDDIAAAVSAAGAADVAVLVLGESADMSGEAHSRTHLGLPGRQQELADAVAATGTPLVVVVMSGRPLVIPRLAEQADALLAAWHGGIRAGRAIADVLFGGVNPSGKLTATWPRTEGQIPIYYSHKNTGRPIEGEGTKQFDEPFKSSYIDAPNSPLFPFGFGLSYTRFEYRDLRIMQTQLALDGALQLSATVANVGDRAGEEVVQLYVRDMVGTVTRPVKELKGFQRVRLEPGTEKAVSFQVSVQDLGFTGLDMRYRVEPGEFAVWIGADSQTGLEGHFTVVASP